MSGRDPDDEPAALPRHARDILARYVALHTMPRDAMERVEHVIRGAGRRRTVALMVGFAIAAACVLAWALTAAWRPTSLAGGPHPHEQASDRRTQRDELAAIPSVIVPAELPAAVPATAAMPAIESAPTLESTTTRRPRAASSSAVLDEDTTTAPAEPASSTITDDDLAAERALLSRAWQALADDDLDGALALVERHRREFAGGVLVPERDALAAIARCRRSPAAAKTIAAEFVRSHGNTALRTRVREACEIVR